ncbi:MAG: hypothetical protein MUF49_30930, partial [Oculatellaceae cyanobacterium Prado106]|nr:hypothetical protein [Oculatellaceae cyanobacterium Prado106]
MSNFAEKYSFSGRESALGRWVTEAIGLPGMRLRSQLRGNDLRLLCEGQPGPRKADVLLRLIPALQRVDLSTLVPAYHPKIYRVQIFGRLTGQQEPIWQALLHLDQLDRHLEQLKRSLQLSPELVFAAVQTGATAASPTRVPIQSPTSRTPLTDNPFQLQEDAELTLDTQAQASRTLEDREAHSEAAALALSNRALAKQGNEYAIALYLSDALSRLGVAVQASAKTLPYTPPAAVHHAEPEVAIDQWSTKRLWIICEAPYSPEASLLSETITAKLRELEIEGFRDAVILFRVLGEAQPDWMLRVVLTPPSEMLRDWARWGDVEAIQRLLNQELQPLGVQVSNAILNATTLHLSCGMVQQGRSAFKAPDRSAPDQQQLKAEIALFLEALAPQGIHAATIYGQVWKQESPAWVDWLTLPASLHPALSESAMELAQQRDWGAIAFLLHRLLNPDLDEYLATGGVRLQLLPKQDLLHIMCEAFVCPSQQQICDAITHLLQPLNLVDIAGIRIYGRRSGEKQPLWKHG